jgi:hypothetical protein
LILPCKAVAQLPLITVAQSATGASPHGSDDGAAQQLMAGRHVPLQDLLSWRHWNQKGLSNKATSRGMSALSALSMAAIADLSSLGNALRSYPPSISAYRTGSGKSPAQDAATPVCSQSDPSNGTHSPDTAFACTALRSGHDFCHAVRKQTERKISPDSSSQKGVAW